MKSILRVLANVLLGFGTMASGGLAIYSSPNEQSWSIICFVACLIGFGYCSTGMWFWSKRPSSFAPIGLPATGFRMWAASVDMLIAWIFTGWVISTYHLRGKQEVLFLFASFGILFCLRDILGIGRSVGKRIFQLVISDNVSGRRCSARQHLLRNLPYFVTIVVLCFGIIIGSREIAPILSTGTLLIWMKPFFSKYSKNTYGDDFAHTSVIYVGEHQF